MMYVYTIIEAIAAVVAGLLLALCTKKAEGLVPTKLDKAGRITNIVFIPLYVCLSPVAIFFGLISSPAHEGFLGIIGWLVSLIIASAPLFCGLGLGLSVALRKKGKSKASFAVQFAGFAGIILSILLYCIFAGNLLRYLN